MLMLHIFSIFVLFKSVSTYRSNEGKWWSSLFLVLSIVLFCNMSPIFHELISMKLIQNGNDYLFTTERFFENILFFTTKMMPISIFSSVCAVLSILWTVRVWMVSHRISKKIAFNSVPYHLIKKRDDLVRIESMSSTIVFVSLLITIICSL